MKQQWMTVLQLKTAIAFSQAMMMKELSESGFLGCLSTGELVDRRKYPQAFPVPENSKLGISKPKQI